MTYSYSMLNTFLSCERKYYYRYVRKIQSKGSIYQYIGMIIHICFENILEIMMNKAQTVDRYNMLYNILKNNPRPDIDMGKYNSKTLFDELIKVVDNIYANINNFKYLWDTKVYFIENSFVYSDGARNFLVKPDYFFNRNNCNYIFDFKVISKYSVKRYTSELTTSDSYIRQLDYYRWVIGNIIGDHDMETYYLFIVKNGGIFPLKVSDKGKNYNRDVVARSVNKIIDSITAKNSNVHSYKMQPMLCNNCDYIKICNKEMHI